MSQTDVESACADDKDEDDGQHHLLKGGVFTLNSNEPVGLFADAAVK